ncbi:MAG: hypothetical protein P8Y64_11165, partial [Gammaproteobacteria bacterium]
MATNMLEKQTPTGPADLTPEQWQGLAQLGTLVNGLGGLLSGPLAGPATETVNKLGALYAENDLPALMEDTVLTWKAMRDSGLMALIRENADFIAETIRLLAPMSGSLVEAVRKMPVESLREDAVQFHRLMVKWRAVSAFIDQHLAGDLAALAVQLTEFVQQNETDAA